MTKHKKANSLGRSLLKKQDRKMEGSSRHTTELHTSNAPVSITENTSVQEFLANAEAAQRSFEAERAQYNIVGHEDPLNKVENSDDDSFKSDVQSENGDDDNTEDVSGTFFSIPKKPDWRLTETGSTEEFHQLEQLTFLKWKRQLAHLQVQKPQLPPFEKNLDFWRQLWKIVEISDVVIQVVDARNPLFFYSQDLADYVKEVAEWKSTVILLNKADFLTPKQRQDWAKHFQYSDMKALFFSATEDEKEEKDEDKCTEFNSARILSPRAVLETVQSLSSASPLTVGFLGYPNVGKSSTINRFLTNKQLQVSATPGKTKHYQTHVLKGDVVLVDGPGLVIPNLSMTKADMVLHGILPIDNLTDWNPAMEKLLTNIPFRVLQKHYGIMASCVTEARRADRKNAANQILSAFGMMRGFMKPGGIPDQSRAARVIFKDYVNGKLLFCYAPPNVEQDSFCKYDTAESVDDDQEDKSLENYFPELRLTSGVHIRGVDRNTTGSMTNGKAEQKHAKKKRKEKARRIYRDAQPYAM